MSTATTRVFNILDTGAVPNGNVLNTLAIQKSIDECSAAGGGRVLVPAGTFFTGTLNLRSDVELYLDADAKLLGSPNAADYPVECDPDPMLRAGDAELTAQNLSTPVELALIRGRDLHNIKISGPGTIDGNGKSPALHLANGDPHRPRLLDFLQCRHVTVSDVTLQNAPFWVERYLGCKHVWVRGVHVFSHSNFNNDAIDIDSDDVLVENCTTDTDDDGLCLKSDRREPCQNVLIRNCTVGSNCNAIKAGTAGTGGFRNITVEHITVQSASRHDLRAWTNCISAISLEVVDGGAMDGVTISDVTFSGVQTPIFIRLGDRGDGFAGEPQPIPVGSINHVTISHVSGRCEGLLPCCASGIPGHEIQNLRLENIDILCPGGGKNQTATATVPEAAGAYPENRMFGPSLPASALYLRHVNDVRLDDVVFRVHSADARPTIAVDDGRNVTFAKLQLGTPVGPWPAIRLLDSQRVFVSDCTLKGPCAAMVSIAGYSSDEIHVWDNDLGKIPAVLIERGARSSASQGPP